MKRTRRGNERFLSRSLPIDINRPEYDALFRISEGKSTTERFRVRLVSKGAITSKVASRAILTQRGHATLQLPRPLPCVQSEQQSIESRQNELIERVRAQFGSPTERHYKSPVIGTRAGCWG